MNAGADASCGAAGYRTWDSLAAALKLLLIEAFTAGANVLWTWQGRRSASVQGFHC